MLDSFNRNITYLRISVTDRCNLRCSYCMPGGIRTDIPVSEMLSVKEISEVVKVAAKIGIDKIRLTGGEPLIRKDIIDIVECIANTPGIKEVTLTTNGILLKNKAQHLKNAGLSRVNVSLDTVNPERFCEITGFDGLKNVLEGIEEALKVGLTPVKINCVVYQSIGKEQAMEVAVFANKHNIKIRFIHQMNLKTGEFSIVDGGDGGNCSKCNRIRLTSDGHFKSCLFSDVSFSIQEHGIEEAMIKAILNKPKCGTYSKSNEFYNVGG